MGQRNHKCGPDSGGIGRSEPRRGLRCRDACDGYVNEPTLLIRLHRVLGKSGYRELAFHTGFSWVPPRSMQLLVVTGAARVEDEGDTYCEYDPKNQPLLCHLRPWARVHLYGVGQPPEQTIGGISVWVRGNV